MVNNLLVCGSLYALIWRFVSALFRFSLCFDETVYIRFSATLSADKITFKDLKIQLLLNKNVAFAGRLPI
jgi:hypothetical protein